MPIKEPQQAALSEKRQPNLFSYPSLGTVTHSCNHELQMYYQCSSGEYWL
uniref:Uncharacterized protein n=1 Tax=Anguilla anguilla TaxID=7936 RepID=A0A0E9TMK9_ANGAN